MVRYYEQGKGTSWLDTTKGKRDKLVRYHQGKGTSWSNIIREKGQVGWIPSGKRDKLVRYHQGKGTSWLDTIREKGQVGCILLSGKRDIELLTGCVSHTKRELMAGCFCHGKGTIFWDTIIWESGSSSLCTYIGDI